MSRGGRVGRLVDLSGKVVRHGLAMEYATRALDSSWECLEEHGGARKLEADGKRDGKPGKELGLAELAKAF